MTKDLEKFIEEKVQDGLRRYKAVINEQPGDLVLDGPSLFADFLRQALTEAWEDGHAEGVQLVMNRTNDLREAWNKAHPDVDYLPDYRAVIDWAIQQAILTYQTRLREEVQRMRREHVDPSDPSKWGEEYTRQERWRTQEHNAVLNRVLLLLTPAEMKFDGGNQETKT